MRYIITAEADIPRSATEMVDIIPRTIQDRFDGTSVTIRNVEVNREEEENPWDDDTFEDDDESTHIHLWVPAGVLHGETIAPFTLGGDKNKSLRQYTLVLIICSVCGWMSVAHLMGHWRAEQITKWKLWKGDEEDGGNETEEGS